MSDELFWGVSIPFLEHIISSGAAALIKFTTYQHKRAQQLLRT